MNTKQKWTKWVGIAVLVALASVVTTGLVASDTPPIGTDQSSWDRFEQILVAQEPMERDYNTDSPSSGLNSWDRFEQILVAQEPMERDYNTDTPSSGLNSWDRFEQYLTAQEQSEQTHNMAFTISPASDGGDSWARFVQYLEHSQ